MAKAAIFLQRAEASLITTRARGAKKRPLCCSSRFCAETDKNTRVRGVFAWFFFFFVRHNFIPAWSDFLTCGKVWKM